MRVRMRAHPQLKSIIFTLILIFIVIAPQYARAEGISISIQRDIATQPITKLEIIAIVKSLLSGRVLSVKKLTSYTNPDCHHVKFLEDQGEFQLIKLGCHTDKVAQTLEQVNALNNK